MNMDEKAYRSVIDKFITNYWDYISLSQLARVRTWVDVLVHTIMIKFYLLDSIISGYLIFRN